MAFPVRDRFPLGKQFSSLNIRSVFVIIAKLARQNQLREESIQKYHQKAIETCHSLEKRYNETFGAEDKIDLRNKISELQAEINRLRDSLEMIQKDNDGLLNIKKDYINKNMELELELKKVERERDDGAAKYKQLKEKHDRLYLKCETEKQSRERFETHYKYVEGQYKEIRNTFGTSLESLSVVTDLCTTIENLQPTFWTNFNAFKDETTVKIGKEKEAFEKKIEEKYEKQRETWEKEWKKEAEIRKNESEDIIRNQKERHEAQISALKMDYEAEIVRARETKERESKSYREEIEKLTEKLLEQEKNVTDLTMKVLKKDQEIQLLRSQVNESCTDFKIVFDVKDLNEISDIPEQMKIYESCVNILEWQEGIGNGDIPFEDIEDLIKRCKKFPAASSTQFPMTDEIRDKYSKFCSTFRLKTMPFQAKEETWSFKQDINQSGFKEEETLG